MGRVRRWRALHEEKSPAFYSRHFRAQNSIMAGAKALILLLLVASAIAQDDAPAEECEEGWEFLEFMKSNIKEKVESLLQEKLFLPGASANSIREEIMPMREEILQRIKDIRGGTITICPDQKIEQEEFFVELRMDIMGVLLKLIEPDADEKLAEIGKDLLAIRKKTNEKITMIIMLREARVTTRITGDDCGLGELYDEIKAQYNKIVEDNANLPDAKELDPEAPEVKAQVEAITMALMMVDTKIGEMYEAVSAEKLAGEETILSERFEDLKEISKQTNKLLLELTGETNGRTVHGLLLEVEDIAELVENAHQDGLAKCGPAPGPRVTPCTSCGADFIDEVVKKIFPFTQLLATDPENAKDTIRQETMAELERLTEEMTKLLKDKVNNENVLEECEQEKLDVINMFKGPLWMLVRTTITGENNEVEQLITQFQELATSKRLEYCAPGPRTARPPAATECEEEEIAAAKEWLVDIDTIIQEHLFKENNKIEAMLGFVDLNKKMEGRVRELFENDLQCPLEKDQIKNTYMTKVTTCLAEMMAPKYKLENLSRAEKVKCIKGLRQDIEQRRGDLLMELITINLAQS